MCLKKWRLLFDNGHVMVLEMVKIRKWSFIMYTDIWF